jgi:hypothetical protein
VLPRVDTLIYSTVMGEFEHGLIDALSTLVPSGCLEICRCHDELPARLRMPHYQSTILVLIAADQEDLHRILSVQPMLNGTRIILVLPDSSGAVTTVGHSLRPRFVTHKENGFQDIVDVVARMISGDAATAA